MLIALMLMAAPTPVTLQAQAQNFFANQSTNPSQAQFRNVRAVGDVVCGAVNKPNQVGGFDGFERFAYRSQNDWTVEHGAYYRMAENGKQLGTEFMFRAADAQLKWDTSKAAELMREADEATSRAEASLAACD